jgi:hypothetical protein
MGFTGGCQSRVSQTWTWDGRDWMPHNPRSSPVEAGQGLILYHGRLRQPLYVNGAGQAWAWSGSDWRPLAMAGGPRVPAPGSPQRSTFAAGYDESRGLLIFVLSDRTWAWDGFRWTSVSGGIDPNDAGPDPHAVYDAAHEQMVYVGQRYTWTWDGRLWQRNDQPRFSSTTMAYDRIRNQVLLVQQDTSDCDRTACRTVTWVWDSKAWTAPRVSHPPLLPLTRSGAYPPPMAFDATHGVIVLLASAN